MIKPLMLLNHSFSDVGSHGPTVCLKLIIRLGRVPADSAYAFFIENFKRSEEEIEVAAFMKSSRRKPY